MSSVLNPRSLPVQVRKPSKIALLQQVEAKFLQVDVRPINNQTKSLQVISCQLRLKPADSLLFLDSFVKQISFMVVLLVTQLVSVCLRYDFICRSLVTMYNLLFIQPSGDRRIILKTAITNSQSATVEIKLLAHLVRPLAC